MNFDKLILTRQSDRNFSEKLIDRKILLKCIEAARLAPSACNSQPWKFIVADEPELVKSIAKCTYGKVTRFNKFTDKASAMAVVVMEPGNITSKVGAVFSNVEYAYIDMGIAVENFCLQAADLGLGTCIIGWSRHRDIKKLLKVPYGKKIGLLIAIGYEKNGKIRPKIRKKTDEMSSFNRY